MEKMILEDVVANKAEDIKTEEEKALAKIKEILSELNFEYIQQSWEADEHDQDSAALSEPNFSGLKSRMKEALAKIDPVKRQQIFSILEQERMSERYATDAPDLSYALERIEEVLIGGDDHEHKKEEIIKNYNEKESELVQELEAFVDIQISAADGAQRSAWGNALLDFRNNKNRALLDLLQDMMHNPTIDLETKAKVQLYEAFLQKKEFTV